MTLLLLSALCAVVVAVMIVRAMRQMARYEIAPRQPPPGRDASPCVTVIVPARNEESGIGRCLDGLLAQDYPADALRIIVVDDGSADRTAEVVRTRARRDSRVVLLEAPPLPSDWVGKSHACWLGAQAAAGGDWLCFIDADTAPRPALISSAVATAAQRRLDMLSLEPFQELGGFWERLIMPAGFFLLAISQDIGRVNDPSQPEAAANGQFILIRADAYKAVGGHGAVRCEICEDGALAALVKRQGFSLGLMGAEELIQTRMYRGLRDLWDGAGRTLTRMVGGPGALAFYSVLAVIIGVAVLALPVWSLVALIDSPRPLTTAAAVLAWSAALSMFCIHLGLAGHFRIPLWYGLLLPLSYSVGAAVAVNSIVCHVRGRTTWKARTYACRSSHQYPSVSTGSSIAL